MSHVNSSIQYICLRKTSDSKMGAPNLLLVPGIIYPRYAPDNLEISCVKKLIHSPSCCKTTMQTNCGLTNCTGNSPETGFSFSFWRLVKSCVSNKFSIVHSYFYCCLSFSFQGGQQTLKNKLVKKQTIFIQHSSKSRTVLSERDCVYEAMKAGSSHAAKKK